MAKKYHIKERLLSSLILWGENLFTSCRSHEYHVIASCDFCMNENYTTLNTKLTRGEWRAVYLDMMYENL